ncbi:MAG: nucleotidyltransferase domain-containing protein [candidate division NC10 bacterium]|nr:nucleotidyltransferase domain-containing protein [candidate division NC10 bacterium]
MSHTTKKARFLEPILGSRSKIGVLRILEPLAAPLTGREIARRAGVGLYPCQRALADLVAYGVIDEARGGRDKLYRLNRDHWSVRRVLRALFVAEANWDLEFSIITRRFFGKTWKVLSFSLYGSFLRGEQRAGSDIDVIAILPNDGDKEKAFELISGYGERIRKRLGYPISPVVFLVEELFQRYRKGDPYMCEVVATAGFLGGIPLPELLKEYSILRRAKKQKKR